MAEFVTSRVVLYKNGIGSFERKGLVNKDATIELFFPAEAMNDILKSINVTSTAEHKHAISYEVPSTSSTATNLTPISTHKDLYTRLLRETVHIKTTGGQVMEGMVIAVDLAPHNEKSGKLSVFTNDNQVVTVAIDSIASMKVPNSLITQSKSLKINITTQQQQECKITYIRSCPVWTPTYRAIFGSSATEYKLYGWATIHNPGPDDWKGTAVSLVAGQPVSFVSEVYKPKYRKRPKMRTSNAHTPLGISGLLVSSLLADESNSESDSDSGKEVKKKTVRGGRDRRRDLSRSMSRSSSRSRTRSRSPNRLAAPAPKPVAETAEAEAADLFRYDLNTPINLIHGHSSLVPIFESTVQGRKVALFNTTLHHVHPFSSLVLSNTTGLSLEAGSITVFDGDMYIGEAHLITTKPNERRFLPFALEQGVVVQRQFVTANSQPYHHVLVERCQTTLSRKSVTVTRYVITNKNEKAIELLLEHPKEIRAGGVSLIVEECYSGEKEKTKIEVKTEYVTGNETSGSYGLNFTIPPRSTTHLVLHAQSMEKSVDSLRDAKHYQRILDERLFAQLNKVLTPYWNLDQQIRDIEQRLASEKESIAELEKSQHRARTNLNALRDNDKQRSRYSEQVDKLEDGITQGSARMRDLTSQMHSNREKLRVLGDSIRFDSATPNAN